MMNGIFIHTNTDTTLVGKEALDNIINMIKELKVDDSCYILIPEMNGYDMYKVPSRVAKIAMTIYNFEIKYGKMWGFEDANSNRK